MIDSASKHESGERISTTSLLLIFIIVALLLYMMGIPWLTCLFHESADLPASIVRILHTTSAPWYLISEVPAFHPIMVQYQSFCFSTAGFQPISDMEMEFYDNVVTFTLK